MEQDVPTRLEEEVDPDEEIGEDSPERHEEAVE